MIKLSVEQEKLLRQLLEKSRRVSDIILEDCNNSSDYGKCIEATKCKILVEELSRSIGYIEDRPDTGNILINQKLPFEDK